MTLKRAVGGLVAVVVAAACILPAGAEASEVSDKLQKLADRLVASYQGKRPSEKGTSLAIFDFTCDEKLAKQRVGYAVSEMLTTHFVGKPGFTVVERSEIEKVFKEQALQQTGAMDVDTAVNLGKVIGAKTLVLGSVEKVGRIYQINARMVDAQSAEMVASSYQELPAEAFEAEAKPHLALVPEVQALGFYLIMQYGAGTLKGITVSHADSNGAINYDATFKVSKSNVQSSGVGGGVRYIPVNPLMLDFAFLPSAFQFGARSEITSTSNATDTNNQSQSRMPGITGMALLAKAYYIHEFNRYFRGFAGAGLDVHILSYESGTGGKSLAKVEYRKSGSNSIQFGMEAEDLPGHLYTVYRPLASLGGEWRPQARVGIAMFCNLYAMQNKVDLYGEITNYDGSKERRKYAELFFPLFELQGSVSVYF